MKEFDPVREFIFDVLAYLVKWYLEKEEADKINRRIAKHRNKCKGKVDEICLVFYKSAYSVHMGMHTELGRCSSIPYPH